MAEMYIDRVFRGYGEAFFGEEAMARITSAQVEEARCFAMRELGRITEIYGRQKNGTAEELFCNYLFEKYI